MKTFALIGLGYISARHIQAIEDVNGQLIYCLDSSEKEFFVNNKTFKSTKNSVQFFKMVKEQKVDFVVICSPSYLHKEQIVNSLKAGCQVIVEKPTCLSLAELNEIQAVERETKRNVFTIFQLRYAKNLFTLQKKNKQKVNVVIEYQGKRDVAYFQSWKGQAKQSGGIVSAVGIHYFDILTHYFGEFTGNLQVDKNELKHSKGWFELEFATVNWNFQFFDQNEDIELKRNFQIQEEKIDLSSYANNLHTVAYQNILDGNGITTNEARKSLEIVEAIGFE